MAGTYNSSHTGAEIDAMVNGKAAKYGLATGQTADAQSNIVGGGHYSVGAYNNCFVGGTHNAAVKSDMTASEKDLLINTGGINEAAVNAVSDYTPEGTTGATRGTAFGVHNMICGNNGFVVGSNTASLGANSVATGSFNIASGTESFVGGNHNIASAASQFVIGEYNKEKSDTCMFIVGNGTSSSNRSNSFEVGKTATRINNTGYLGASTAITSDENQKNSIDDIPEKYYTMFDLLRPVIYKYNNGTSNRYHVGFIAQDVAEALSAADIETSDFAGYVVDSDGTQYLRYEEFIALAVGKIKDLEDRVAALETSSR